MIEQYPHTLRWQAEGTPPGEDEDGFPIPGTPGEAMEAKCRHENWRGEKREFIGVDGATVLQKGIIYIKFGELVPDRFQSLTVIGKDDVDIIFEGIALNSYKGQMNSTIDV